MQQYHQPPNAPYPGFQQPMIHNQQPAPPQFNTPPPMRMTSNQILNATTNQPLYAYTLSRAPDSTLPDSLLQLQHLPSGAIVGETHRSGAAAGNDPTGCCSFLRCFSPDPDEDVISVGGQKALICDASVGRDCWSWKPTWFGEQGMEEWAVRKEKGALVLRIAVSGGEEVLRVEKGGELAFSSRGIGLNEMQVGEVLLVLVGLRTEREEDKKSLLWEILAW